MGTTAFDPWRWATARGIRVELAQMRGTGLWLPGERTILIDQAGTRRQQRCSLAHECGHVAMGHRGRTAAQERIADEWAAGRLVSPEAMERAERIVGSSAFALAEELDVAPWVIVTWREMWDRAA